MKETLTLTIMSLLSVLFLSFHLADDIVRGMEKGGVTRLTIVPILVVWLYATLVLTGRRSGYIIILIGSLLALVVPVIHTMGKALSPDGVLAKSTGGFFFAWSLISLGVT